MTDADEPLTDREGGERARFNTANATVSLTALAPFMRLLEQTGQDAVTADGTIVGKGDLAAQTTQILTNIETALAAVGAGLEHVIKWNVLVVEGQPIEAGFGAFRAFWGTRSTPPPLITAAFVAGLGHPDWLAEIDAIAVVPA